MPASQPPIKTLRLSHLQLRKIPQTLYNAIRGALQTSKMLNLVSSVVQSDRERVLRINATIVFHIIRYLGPASPHDFATRRHQAQFTHIHLDHRPLGQHAQLRVHGVLRVLLHADDRQLHRDAQLGVRHIRTLVPQAHGADEALVLDGTTRERLSDEGRLGHHALPRLLGGFLAGLDHAEHFLFRDAFHAG